MLISFSPQSGVRSLRLALPAQKSQIIIIIMQVWCKIVSLLYVGSRGCSIKDAQTSVTICMQQSARNTVIFNLMSTRTPGLQEEWKAPSVFSSFFSFPLLYI